MNNHAKDLVKQLRASAHSMRPHELFSSVISQIYIACSISAATNQEDRDADLKEAREIAAKLEKLGISRDEQMTLSDAFCQALAETEHDLLGEVAAELEALDKGMGQFFTPWDLSLLNCRLCVDPEDIQRKVIERGYISIHEPTVGAGGMALAFAHLLREMDIDVKTRLLVDANELERDAFRMCYVQLSMRDIPALIRHGNTLTQGFHVEKYTPAYYRWFLPALKQRQEIRRLFEFGGQISQESEFPYRNKTHHLNKAEAMEPAAFAKWSCK